MTYEVVDNVPLPASKAFRYPWFQMDKVGKSFVIPYADMKRSATPKHLLQNVVQKGKTFWKKTYNLDTKFVYRVQEDGSARIWREV